MTALITGATGFLGGHLVRRLSERGERVRILARATSDLAGVSAHEIDVAEGDISDLAAVAAAVDGVDVVYHLAARNDLGEPDPALMRRVNVEGTRHVLEQTAARDVLAVYVSSVAALGPTPDTAQDESWWAAEIPDSSYARTKREAHELALRIAAAGGRVRMAMPGYIYGPGDPTPMNDLFDRFLNGRIPIGYLPDLHNSFVHVDDCADLLLRMADTGGNGETYIAGAQAMPMRAVFNTLADVSGRRRARVWMRPGLVKAFSRVGAAFSTVTGISEAEVRESVAMSVGVNWSFTGEKARRELGWRPRSLEAGLADVAASLRR